MQDVNPLLGKVATTPDRLQGVRGRFRYVV
jgi:hypothetical protein